LPAPTIWTRIAGRRRVWRREFRESTVRFRRPPDFLVIGGQGCGTTSFYSWLCGHPQVDPASRKELHYFDKHYEKGSAWYRSQFPIARPGRITGEATPFLLLHPLAPERVAHDLPATTRLILLLREPADRALSRYQRARQLGQEPETLQRALELEQLRLADNPSHVPHMDPPHDRRLVFSYLTGGHYAHYIREWHRHIDPERFITLESEEFFQVAEVRAGFLNEMGLHPYDEPFPLLNTTADHSHEDARVRERLEEYYSPHNEELFTLLGRRLWGK
jgi:hypothetical protein